jgi:rare lipoprotein A
MRVIRSSAAYDRGAFVHGRVIDLSVSAARALGMMRAGVIRVSVE